MKNIIAAVLLTILSLSFFGCASTPERESRHAIVRVLGQKGDASSECVYYTVDGEEIAALQIHGLDYLDKIKKIDVSACPEPFRHAWADYCNTWAQKLKKENDDDDSLDLISEYKGELSDLPTLRRSLEAYDTKPAWQRCEQIAAQYGVKIQP
jgi:hypothetical protein